MALAASLPARAVDWPPTALLVGGRTFTDEDLNRTYGTLPEIGLRVLLPFEPRTHFFLGAGAVLGEGDPHYGQAHFSGEGAARLRLMPLEFGVRTNTIRHPWHSFFVGVAVQYTRASERIRGDVGGSAAEGATYVGWGWGGRVLAGPEWRFGRGTTGVGIEISYGVGHVYAEHEYRQREVGLTGLRLCGYLVLDL
jgi:hypothetical protein